MGEIGPRAKKVKPTWTVAALPGEPKLIGTEVPAWTKSEARAALKRTLGRRLPPGVLLERSDRGRREAGADYQSPNYPGGKADEQ